MKKTSIVQERASGTLFYRLGPEHLPEYSLLITFPYTIYYFTKKERIRIRPVALRDKRVISDVYVLLKRLVREDSEDYAVISLEDAVARGFV